MSDTREKLIKLLAECFDKCLKSRCTECDHFSAPPIIGNSRSCQANLFADHLIANGVTVADNLSPTEPLTNCQQWIPVTERLPEEHDSIFVRFHGTEKWTPGMFRTVSNDVNACVEYEDGTRKVKTLHTLDGKWNLKGMGGKKVTHWMPLPEPPKGE